MEKSLKFVFLFITFFSFVEMQCAPSNTPDYIKTKIDLIDIFEKCGGQYWKRKNFWADDK